jgi:hypothetical protein
VQAAGTLIHLVVDATWLASFMAGTRMGHIRELAGGWSLLDGTPCV